MYEVLTLLNRLGCGWVGEHGGEADAVLEDVLALGHLELVDELLLLEGHLLERLGRGAALVVGHPARRSLEAAVAAAAAALLPAVVVVVVLGGAAPVARQPVAGDVYIIGRAVSQRLLDQVQLELILELLHSRSVSLTYFSPQVRFHVYLEQDGRRIKRVLSV